MLPGRVLPRRRTDDVAPGVLPGWESADSRGRIPEVAARAPRPSRQIYDDVIIGCSDSSSVHNAVAEDKAGKGRKRERKGGKDRILPRATSIASAERDER